MFSRRELDLPNPFYTVAEPCESCGEPTYQGRIWNQEHELWVAVDCSCNTPEFPTCPLLIPQLELAETVQQVCDVIRGHRATCHLCGPQPITPDLPVRQQSKPEGDRGTGQRKEAA
jgi:hypothetical protein